MSVNDNEVSKIMDFLGRGKYEGNVQGTHLGQILTYLSRQKTESMKKTLSKLALVCAMTRRNLKENYIEGLDAFGIIKTKSEGHELLWLCVGERAFNGINISEFQKPKSMKNHCKNCDKEIPSGNNFCSIGCINAMKDKLTPIPEGEIDSLQKYATEKQLKKTKKQK